MQMRWMDPFLKDGQTAGRIRCPNTKCGAKLGCYDWAGICCACHVGGKWVTPVRLAICTCSHFRGDTDDLPRSIGLLYKPIEG